MTRTAYRSLPLTLGDQVVPVLRTRRGKPIKCEKGDRYFLVVWPDGLENRVFLEEHWFGSGRIRGALEVGVIDLRNGFVIEETRTRNQPSLKRYLYTCSVPPPGRGWSMADDSHDKFTTWARLRDWAVLA